MQAHFHFSVIRLACVTILMDTPKGHIFSPPRPPKRAEATAFSPSRHEKETSNETPELPRYRENNDIDDEEDKSECGGGTGFPELNITVQPKKGSALLWPSVLDEKPNEKDDRTDHEALAVKKGIKYGANAW